MVESPEAGSQTVKECIRCGTEIPERAHFCRYCDGYQDARRFLSPGGSLVPVLSLLVAGLSLIIGNLEKIRDLVDPPKAVLSVEVTDDSPELNREVRLSIVNSGRQVGVLRGAFECRFPEIGDIYMIRAVIAPTAIVAAFSATEVTVALDAEELWDRAGTIDTTSIENDRRLLEYASTLTEAALDAMHPDTVEFWKQADKEESDLVEPYVEAALQSVIEERLECASPGRDVSEADTLNRAFAVAIASSLRSGSGLLGAR